MLSGLFTASIVAATMAQFSLVDSDNDSAPAQIIFSPL